MATLAPTTLVQASAPAPVGVWPEGPALAVEKAGDLALVANGRVVRTYDVSDPALPRELGSVVLPGAVLDLEIAGDHAYAAVLGIGVAVVDLRRPEAPRLVECPGCLLPDGACSVTLTNSAQYTFVRAGAQGEGGVVSFFMSSPTELSFVARTAPTNGSQAVRSVAVDDDLLYVVDDVLRIFEIPGGEPTLLASAELETGSTSRKSMVVAEQRAFLGSSPDGWPGPQPSLEVLDVSDPELPVQLCYVDQVAGGIGIAVDAAGNLIASAGPGLFLTSIEDPSVPSLIGTYEPGGWPRDLALDGEVVIAALGSDGAHLVDIADPTAPAAWSTIGTAAEAIDLRWVDDLLIAILASGDVRLVDASDPGQPVEVGRVPPPAGGAWGAVVVTDQILFASGRTSSGTPGEEVERDIIRAIEISSPAEPVVLGELEVDGLQLGLARVTDDLLVATTWCGDQRCLNAVDVSDPATMFVGSRLAGDYTTDFVAIDGRLLVAANGVSALEVIDVADPAAMAVVGMRTGEYTHVLSVDEALVLAIAGWTSVEVIDVADPSAPVAVATLDFAARRDLLGVTRGSGGLIYLLRSEETDDLGVSSFITIVDVSDPYEPRVRARAELPLGVNERAREVVPVGAGRVAVTTFDAIASDVFGPPVIVVDVSIPARPVAVGRVSSPAAFTVPAARGSLLAMGTTLAGITFWDLSDMSSRPAQPQSPEVE